MKILISGGAGFIGATLAREFKKSDPACDVWVLDNLHRRGSEMNLPGFKRMGIHFIHGDIRIPEDLDQLESAYDVFIECSAEPSVLAGLNSSPQYVLQSNLTGTLNCLEFARKRCGFFLFLSTSKVYSIQPLRSLPLVESDTRFVLQESGLPLGASPQGISEEFTTQSPRSIYGATKLASELIIQEYAFNYGLKSLINRCGVISGPGQFGKTDQGIFSLWIANHFFCRPLSYTGFGGYGKQVRDILHPLDLFDLIEAQIAQARYSNGEIFNVGGGVKGATSLLEYTHLAQEVTGNCLEIKSVNESSTVDVSWYVSDTRSVEQSFDWKPKRDLHNIASDTLSWVKNQEQVGIY